MGGVWEEGGGVWACKGGAAWLDYRESRFGFRQSARSLPRLAGCLDGWSDEDRQHYGEMCSSNVIRVQRGQDVIRSRRRPAAAAELSELEGLRSAGILALTSSRRGGDGLCAGASGSGDTAAGLCMRRAHTRLLEFTMCSALSRAAQSLQTLFMLAAHFCATANSDGLKFMRRFSLLV